ncbi:hypothetical protein [Aurantiacibacter spongiae]|uniref:Uncharacterized protein n=1 Tax=Aurantiacibacter spongiae TaxID=2488860 RepID=A0A3N5DN66_9SPHN|nr:hypothetical protein [Aurantiacibacter spongiae]RPF70471.1 hypothetical protein EG799_01625 [Aurantiacibacter spongiae]
MNALTRLNAKARQIGAPTCAEAPRVEFDAWPSWPLRWERWKATPFHRDCLRSIRDDAENRDEAVYWAAQGALDTGDASNWKRSLPRSRRRKSAPTAPTATNARPAGLPTITPISIRVRGSGYDHTISHHR